MSFRIGFFGIGAAPIWGAALRAGICALAAAAISTAPASATRRALVIGNSDYANAPDLPNPRNDAEDVAARLQEIGFEISGGGAQHNLTSQEMARAVREFSQSLESGDLALFFFAGHGAQAFGDNYLIPSNDENIGATDDLPDHAYSANFLLARLESRPGVTSVVFLDACRNNPLTPRTRNLTGEGGGLAHMDAPRSSPIFIMFAAAKGRTASDGAGRNSVFTTALLSALERPARRLEDIQYDISKNVRLASNGTQIPWTNSSLDSAVFLAPPVENAGAATTDGDTPLDNAILPDADATYGVHAFDAAAGTEPLGVFTLAGGALDVSAVAPDCIGLVAAAPDVAVEVAAGGAPLDVSVASAGDTVLAVMDPAGVWTCNDDADGLNPAVRFETPESGLYRIWVGAYNARVGLPGADLTIAAGAQNAGAADPDDADEETMSGGDILADGAPAYETIALAAGFEPDPARRPVIAGGPAAADQLGGDCRGFIARQPDYAVEYEAGDYPLHFSAISIADTVLVVRDPSGAWSCNDDVYSVHPAVSFPEPRSGTYRIWIGTYAPVSPLPNAELAISEVQPRF